MTTCYAQWLNDLAKENVIAPVPLFDLGLIGADNRG